MKHVCAENPMRVIKKVDTEIGKGDKEERIEPRRGTDLHGDTTSFLVAFHNKSDKNHKKARKVV